MWLGAWCLPATPGRSEYDGMVSSAMDWEPRRRMDSGAHAARRSFA